MMHSHPHSHSWVNDHHNNTLSPSFLVIAKWKPTQTIHCHPHSYSYVNAHPNNTLSLSFLVIAVWMPTLTIHCHPHSWVNAHPNNTLAPRSWVNAHLLKRQEIKHLFYMKSPTSIPPNLFMVTHSGANLNFRGGPLKLHLNSSKFHVYPAAQHLLEKEYRR